MIRSRFLAVVESKFKVIKEMVVKPNPKQVQVLVIIIIVKVQVLMFES